MSDSLKWKSKLLASSLPVEYEVAKLLVRRQFTVRADYPYQRIDAGIQKEFSVDIHADTFIGACPSDNGSPSLHLLVECKYRHPGTTWFFLPDPNEVPFSPLAKGSGIRTVDAFSHWFVHDSVDTPEDGLPWCYKGIEIDTTAGSVYDSELRHGLLQLQYALPALFSDLVREVAFTSSAESLPFFCAPILVTTATLRVARKNFAIAEVNEARDLPELGRVVNAVLVFAETGPEFVGHAAAHFQYPDDTIRRPPVLAIEQYRVATGATDRDLPSAVIRRFATGDVAAVRNRLYNHFFVCNIQHFGVLASSISKAVTRASRKMNKNSVRQPHAQKTPRRANSR